MGIFVVVLKKICVDRVIIGDFFRIMNYFVLYIDFEIISCISLIYGDYGFDFCIRNWLLLMFCILFICEDYFFLVYELVYNDL